jgi:hypothetical protein
MVAGATAYRFASSPAIGLKYWTRHELGTWDEPDLGDFGTDPEDAIVWVDLAKTEPLDDLERFTVGVYDWDYEHQVSPNSESGRAISLPP